MAKTILITGATDGIGKLTAEQLVKSGHTVILHGRNPNKLAAVAAELGGSTTSVVADLSNLAAVVELAAEVRSQHNHLDVLINNAGVLKTAHPITATGQDVRFVVNTVAPYVLTQLLLPILGSSSRVVNLSSAAQAPIDIDALLGHKPLPAMPAYSQSKLAITIWTQVLATEHPAGPLFVSVNPGSLLATKMVKEGFGVSGTSVDIGADILIRAALSDEFVGKSGAYYDNDAKRFSEPHPAAGNAAHRTEVMTALRSLAAASLSTTGKAS